MQTACKGNQTADKLLSKQDKGDYLASLLLARVVPPKVGATIDAGDVEQRDALQSWTVGQVQGHPVTLEGHRKYKYADGDDDYGFNNNIITTVMVPL